MYCIQCGVRLADTEKICPLCGTRVYHPDLEQADANPLYPSQRVEPRPVRRWSVMLIITILYLLPISICLVTDLSYNARINWSGYVIGALVLFYTAVLLPSWFRRPNPVIFVPISFGVLAAYLLYICLATGGSWFLSLAFPVTGALCLIVTAVVTLTRYIRKGWLYVYGGAVIALGAFAVLLEFLLHITFRLPPVGTWSLYPLVTLTLLGLAMIATATFKPLRERLEKRFFI